MALLAAGLPPPLSRGYKGKAGPGHLDSPRPRPHGQSSTGKVPECYYSLQQNGAAYFLRGLEVVPFVVVIIYLLLFIFTKCHVPGTTICITPSKYVCLFLLHPLLTSLFGPSHIPYFGIATSH